MNCREARSRLSAYLDRDLTFEEEARLRQHLQQCAECQGELDCLERVVTMLRELPQTDAEAGFYANLRARIQEEEGSARVPRQAPALAGLTALRTLFQGRALRPAFGAALGLAAGLLIGVNSPQLAALLNGAEPLSGHVAESGVAAGRPSAMETSSPLASIDLPPLEAFADSVRLDGEPEYILEPYVTDPNRGLVPAGGPYGSTVGTDWDAQSDVYVTF